MLIALAALNVEMVSLCGTSMISGWIITFTTRMKSEDTSDVMTHVRDLWFSQFTTIRES